MKIILGIVAVVVLFFGGIYWNVERYNAPEAIKARSDAQIERAQAAEQRAAQREADRIERERIAAEKEAAKTPEQRQKERDAKAAAELDANTISVGEYMGLKLIGF